MCSVRPSRAEIALLSFGLVSALLLAEGAARLLSRLEREPRYAPVRTDRKERRPVNSRGYRDLERRIPAPAGTRRALCIGDSFTWGDGVLFDDTWPQRLERLLGRERGEVWEAVNLGERGLNTVQEAAKLASEGFAYQPDVVIVGYVLNDSEDENAAEARRQPVSAIRSLLDHSTLVRILRSRINATLENRRRVQDFRAMYAEGYPGWVAGRRALRTMAGLCRERGVPLVVAIFPLFANPLDEDYPFAGIHAQVAQAAGEAGARVVDLLPFYRGLDWRYLAVDGARDEHPNEIAYRIAAQAIARVVDEVVPRASRAAKAL
jgi:lysophospholipase L1-like esterase